MSWIDAPASAADHLHDPDTYRRSRETFRARREAAFWSMTNRSGECWEWTGRRQTPNAKRQGGYGLIQRHGRSVYAHRHAYELVNGAIPVGLYVLHRCDNPPCINPAHLYAGTQSDNMRDVWARGRRSTGRAA